MDIGDKEIKRMIRSKSIFDYEGHERLLACLEKKDYEGSFDYIRENDEYTFEEAASLSALWSRYLYENGHKDFLEHMDYVPFYCLAYSNIKEVHIHKNIRGVAFNAFMGCKKLEKITVDSENEFYYYKDNWVNAVIDKEDKRLIVACKSTKLPKGLKEIDSACFDDIKIDTNEYEGIRYLGVGKNPYYVCLEPVSKSIKEAKLHPDCKIIRDSAFIGCVHLKSVEINEGIKIIPTTAFSNCKHLASIVMPCSLREVKDFAFENCWSLRVLEFPEGTKRLGKNVIDGDFIKVLVIPESMKVIEEEFRGGSQIDFIAYPGLWYDYTGIKNHIMWESLGCYEIVCKDQSRYRKNGLRYGRHYDKDDRRFKRKVIKLLGRDLWK